ncbi:hypothetical protein [Croceicoccus mobilis]|uniref:Uncharacterized protein n=1 Tax=Croceicoccus mobilis TaxID=1703339 RepID=A0A917DZI8_9SPHN|nr:hypothetical protein [Croceicoccus mobilis]GGD82341.1 hypothetical protein GCM10010990_35460 [Croceicoccus mobilis]
MKITIADLEVVDSMSEETTAYTAHILIDGSKAFHASNRGTGGADYFYPLQDYDGPTLAAVDAYLKETEPPCGPFEPDPAHRAAWDRGIQCDLETYVSRLITTHEAKLTLARKTARNIVAIGPDKKVYSFKMAPSPGNIASFKEIEPNYEIVNGADEEVMQAALAGISGEPDYAEQVYERQRGNRLTRADALWLKARNEVAEKPCPDLRIAIDEFIADEQARYDAYRAANCQSS